MLSKKLTCLRLATLLLLCFFLLLQYLYTWDLAYPGNLLSATLQPQPQPAPTTTTTLQASPVKTETTGEGHHHLAYRKRCYRYHQNLTAENTCCQLHNFSNDQHSLHTCIRRANDDLSASVRSDMTKQGNGAGIARNVHWYLVGDSHLRYIFAGILKKFNHSGVQYRQLPDADWHGIVDLDKYVTNIVGNKSFEVRDLSINFTLTCLWKPHLDNLTTLLADWEEQPYTTTPTLVVIGTALHWMVRTQSVYKTNGPKAAAAEYRKMLENLRPRLVSLAKRTTVVFKLQDYVLQAWHPKSDTALYTHTNYPLYNRVAIEVLKGTGVIIWDSTISLSYIYNKECIHRPKDTPKTFYWKCNDPGHVGFIVVDQYADMVINDYCHKYINWC